MRLIPVKQATTLLKKMCNPKSQYREIKLFTAKKDRSITVKNDGENLTLIEDGYLHFEKEYSLAEPAECRHALLAALKRNFLAAIVLYLNAIRK